MFTKIKTWFRNTVADEVAKVESSIGQRLDKVETSLELEKAKLVSAVSIHVRASLIELENESKKLLEDFEQKLIAEASVVVAEKNKLLEEMHAGLLAAQQAAHQLTHWKADAETSQADHSLKVVK